MKHLIALCLALLSQSALAGLASWHMNGFLSQTALSTSDNAFLGETDDAVSLNYREAALILRGEVIPKLDFAAQALSRKAGVGDDGSPKLDYGFFTWRAWENERFFHSLILGKLKAPVGFYNETRESPFTRSSIFLPQSIYIDRARNTGLSAEEIMYSGELRKENWVFSTKLGRGKVRQDQDEIMDVYSMPDYFDVEFTNNHAWHAQIAADYDYGRLRLAYTKYSAPVDFKGTVLGTPVSASSKIQYEILSAEINQQAWSLTTEAFRALVKPEAAGFGVDHPQGIYLQYSLNLGNNWDTFVRYDQIVLNKNDRNGEIFEGSPTKNYMGLPAFVRYAKDYSFGMSYRPSKAWLLRLEFHDVQGTAWMTARDLNEGQLQVKNWNLFAVAVSWRF